MARTALVLTVALPSLCLSLLGCGDGTTTSSTGTTNGGAGGDSGGSAGSTSSTSEGGAGAGAGGGATSSGGSSGTTTSAGGGGSASSTGGGGAATGCLADLSAGHHEVTCDGGVVYDVEIPVACAQDSCGLIVDMHGYTMNGDSEDENTGMRALGKQHGYVIVQPTAPKDAVQFPSWDQASHAPLVHAFLVEIAAGLPIDPARIHAMGFSQGGGMTFRLLCQHADFFASGAPIGAIAGCEFSGQNKPSEEVDILQVHGHTDGVVNFQSTAIPQRDAALGAWSFGAPVVLEDDGAHKATRSTTPSGTVFEFWEHDYETSAQAVFLALKGHCVPGGTDFDGTPAGYSCETAGTFVFGQLAMQFFIEHPKN